MSANEHEQGFKIPNSWFWAVLILAAFVAIMWYFASQRNVSNEIEKNKAKQEQLQDSMRNNTADISNNNDATVKDAANVVVSGRKAAKRINAPVAVRDVKTDSLWVEIFNEENTKEL